MWWVKKDLVTQDLTLPTTNIFVLWKEVQQDDPEKATKFSMMFIFSHLYNAELDFLVNKHLLKATDSFIQWEFYLEVLTCKTNKKATFLWFLLNSSPMGFQKQLAQMVNNILSSTRILFKTHDVYRNLYWLYLEG